MKQFWIVDFGFSVGTYKSKKVFGLALNTMLFALCVRVEAQQPPGKVSQIGFLTTGSRVTEAPRIEAFRQGLREFGYVEGKNINVEYRYADGRLERLPELTEELGRLKIDLLVVANATVAQAAKKSTTTIPIVMPVSGDPIGTGLVASLARPGGNVTGFYNYSPELVGKRVELLKEVLPKVSRYAFLNTTDGIAARFQYEEQGRAAAKALAIQFQLVEVKAANPDFDDAFRVIVKDRVGAIVVSSSPVMGSHRKRILSLVEHTRIPAMYAEQTWPNVGGLMSYGANFTDLYRRSAVYVDKILKGAKPADLPVEQPSKFELVINLKTAKQIGLTIPPNVLARADRVIR
jgi:putative ABC transport system substrate-binding protein